MHTYSSNLQLTLSRIRDAILRKTADFERPQKTVFPKRIMGFKLSHEVAINKSVNFYKFAIYKDKSGKSGFAKAWFGKYKNTPYYWLRNEIAVAKEFTSAYKNSVIEYKAEKFRTPKLYTVYEQSGALIMLSEEIKNSKESFGPTETLKLYNESLDFINQSGSKMFVGKKNSILAIKPLKILFSLPVVFVMAILSRPQAVNQICASCIFILKNSLGLFASDWSSLVHRDLRGTILKSGKNYYIIDWQTAAISSPMLDIAQLFLTHWENSKLTSNLFKLRAVKSIFANKNTCNIFKSICLYLVLFEMGFVKIKAPSDEKSFIAKILKTTYESQWVK